MNKRRKLINIFVKFLNTSRRKTIHVYEHLSANINQRTVIQIQYRNGIFESQSRVVGSPIRSLRIRSAGAPLAT